MTCSQADCIQTDVQPYKRYIGHGLVMLCGSCAASLQAIGMSLTPVERRVEDVTPLVERRRTFRPAWLSKLTARADDSWRTVA